MITQGMLYWITRLDHIRTALMIPAFMLLVVGIVYPIFRFLWFTYLLDTDHSDEDIDHSDEDIEKAKNRFLKSLRVSIAATLIWIPLALIPTTKEYAAIVIVPKVANSEDVQGLGTGLVDLANEWFEELKPVKKVDGK
jgi:hypothetical protein